MKIQKEACEKYFYKEFKFKTRKLVCKQIENYFAIEDLNFELAKHKYKLNDDVVLHEYNLLHGIGKNEKALDFVAQNGIVSKEAVGCKAGHAVKFVSGFWRVKKEILLKDYILNYSGMDVCYENNRELVPYGALDCFVEKMKNIPHWKWQAESPMEIRFMPSLAQDINQYGFILNIKSNEAQKLVELDVNTARFGPAVKKKFGLQNLNGNGKKNGVFNYIERASYIVLGLNKCFIEGVLVGRNVEKDKSKLEHLKKIFPNCYICNLDGKIIAV